MAHQQQAHYPQAIAAFKQGLVKQANYLPCLRGLADSLILDREYQEAEKVLKQLISCDPNSPEVYNDLGNLYHRVGKFNEAVASFQHALSLKKDPRTWANLASAYENLNCIEQAKEAVKAGLVLSKDEALLYFVQGLCDERAKDYPSALKHFQQALRYAKDVPVRVSAHFGCGKIYDKLHESERAYEYFVKGNQLAFQSWHKEPKEGNAFSQEVDMLLQTITPVWVEAWKQSEGTMPTADASPIFLVGFPRSGTTLLAQMLASHPDCQLLDETGAGQTVQDELAARAAGYPNALLSLQQKDILDLQACYDHVVAQHIQRNPQQRLIDKMPMNMTMVPMLLRLFPDARFVFIVRHPCDACFSCFMNSFDYNSAMANFCDLQSTVSLYTRMMQLWKQYLAYFPMDLYTIRYEDLIADFQGQLHALLAHLQLPWDDAVKQYHQHAQHSVIRTPSYKQASQTIYQEAKYRWLRYKKQLAPYQEQLKPFIQQFGYTQIAE